mgnify:CR=1 FL=1
MDQPNDPSEDDGNALTSSTEVGILGQGIADGSLPDKSVTVESNQARSAQALWLGKQPTYDRLRIF